MTQRYEKLYSFPDSLYCQGSPIIIRAGQLLRDSVTGKLLAQIKYQNISPKTISTVSVKITAFDSAGRPSNEPVIHTYTDLKAPRDAQFGAKSALVIPESDIQSFDAAVTELVFEDGSRWNWDESPWSPLKAQISLAEKFQDEELATQYQVRYGSDCKFEPSDDMGLWFCTCGSVNYLEERSCHKCRRVYAALRDVNISSLKSECAVRLENEKEQQAIEAENSRQKKKTIRSLTLALIPVLLVIVLVSLIVPREIRRHKEYTAAQELINSGQYDEAADAFESLEGYKDSSEQAKSNIPYEEALDIMRYAETADPLGLKLIGVTQSSLSEDDNISVILYEAASKRFEELGDYKDSARLSDKCLAAIEEIRLSELQAKYDAAKLLLDDKQFCLARDAFLALGDFSDSTDMARESIYQKAMCLYGFMAQRSIRDVYAIFSTETGVPGKISFSKDLALQNGEGYITEFKAACGKDAVDFLLEDEPSEGLVPFEEALTSLFESLGDYKDSAKYIPQIAALCDYTSEFYAYVEEGDIFAAYDWLSAYEYEFQDREEWLELLDMYKPYCGSWSLKSGDSSLIPYIAGVSRSGTNVCKSFTSRVIISEDTAELVISNAGDEEYSISLSCERGNSKGFSKAGNPPYSYFANISILNRLAIMKYDGNGNIVSSCDYVSA